MTHDEAERLLPEYALGVLQNAAELEAHLQDCASCAAELASLLEATARLAEAVEPIAPPPSLRARVLAHAPPVADDRSDPPGPTIDLPTAFETSPFFSTEAAPTFSTETAATVPSERAPAVPSETDAPTSANAFEARSPDSESTAGPRHAPTDSDSTVGPRRAPTGRVLAFPRRFAARWLATAAALIFVVGALAAGNVVQQQQLQATRAELTLDRSGLALLTSTETANARLAPVPPFGGDAHGHWFHRAGVSTQVLVVEAMPAAPPGEAYWGWLQRKNGAWIAAGSFTLDRTGYARIILPGDDGSDIQRVEVTRQASASAIPDGTIVLRWP